MTNTLPSECDVVVIGAGIAGMTASALLAASGLRVALLEEQPRLGGYFSGFTRNGYTFNTSIQWLNQCAEGGLVNRIYRHIGPDFPVCRAMDRIRRYRGKSFDYILTRDPYAFRDQLIRDFPDDKKGISRFFEDCKWIGGHLDKLKALMRVTETMSAHEKMAFGLKMVQWTVPVWKYFRMQAEEGLDRYFKSDGIKKIFCSEDKFMSVIMPICWAFTGDFQSPPEGGSEAFVNWLAGKIQQQASSHIARNSPVQKVIVKEGQARGVTLADGRTVRSSYVVAACDAESLYARMLPPGAVPDSLVRRMQEADIYQSSVTVFLGLDCDASVLGLQEELTCVTADNVARVDHAGKDPRKVALIVQAPSARDKSLAPPGKSTMTIHCAAWMDYENGWRTEKNYERGEAYRQLKQEFADILIDRVEKALNVDIRKYIDVLEVATPVTYWRYTKNRFGTAMGAKPTDRNIFRKVAHYYTPVKNLLLGGHWAEYGGGMPIAVKAASNVSLLILKEMKKKEFYALRDVMDDK